MPLAVLLALTAALATPAFQAVPRTGASRPHTFGLGGAIVAGTSGIGGNFRYWFSDRVGVDFGAAWSRPRISADERASIAQVAPSVIFVLRSPNPGADVEIRPFVGAGLTWVSSSAPPRSGAGRTSTALAGRTSGTGGQAFGGIEMVFADAPSLAISVQGVYTALPSGVYSVNTIDGFNVVLAVHYYIR